MALKAVAAPLGSPVGGSGTANTIPRWGSGSPSTTLTDSGLIDDSTSIYTSTRRVGVDTSTTLANVKFQVGSASALSNYQGAPVGFILPTGNGTWMEFAENSTNGTSFRISKDSTTGVLFNANGKDIGFVASGYQTFVSSSQLVLKTSGNVGIGTASPGAILHTLGTGTTTGIFATSSANAWVELRRSTSTTLGYIGTGSGLVTGGAAADLAFRCESGNLLFSTVATERARIDSSGRLGIGQTPTTYILETATDASFYGVVVGRGAGGVSTNTAVGSNALASNSTGSTNTAVGAYAGYRHTVNTAVAYVGYAAGRYQTGGLNTAVGYQAMLGVDGSSNGALNTAVGSESLTALTSGANNTALGRQSGLVLTEGGSNVLLGLGAGNTITTGSKNICIGVNATTAAAGDSNQLVIGASGNYVATNGGATTWYTTATAQSTGVLPATCGFIRVRLNGTYVKIPVYAD